MTDLIDLVAGVDGILQAQAGADTGYFTDNPSMLIADQRRAEPTATAQTSPGFETHSKPIVPAAAS